MLDLALGVLVVVLANKGQAKRSREDGIYHKLWNI